MTESELKIYFLVMGTVMFIVIFPLWLINVLHYTKELRKIPTPQPFRTQLRKLFIYRTFANIISHITRSKRIEELKDRCIFIDWDVRWGPNGRNLGRIIEILPRESGHQLQLKLESPIQIGENIFDEAIFQPGPNRVNLNQYFMSTVFGRLKPSSNNEKSLSATCELLAY